MNCCKGAVNFFSDSEANYQNLLSEMEEMQFDPLSAEEPEDKQMKLSESHWKMRVCKILLILSCCLIIAVTAIITGIVFIRISSSCDGEVKAIAAPKPNKTDADEAVPVPVPVPTALTNAATSSILIRRLNGVKTSVDPCDNFYEYACGLVSSGSDDTQQTKVNAWTLTNAILKSRPAADDVKPLADAKRYFKSCVDAKQEPDVELVKRAIANVTIDPETTHEDYFVEKNMARLLKNGFHSFLDISVETVNGEVVAKLSKIRTWYYVATDLRILSEPTDLAYALGEQRTITFSDTSGNLYTFDEMLENLSYKDLSQSDIKFSWKTFFLELVDPSSHHKLLNANFTVDDVEFLRESALKLKNAPLSDSLHVLEQISFLAFQNEQYRGNDLELSRMSLLGAAQLESASFDTNCAYETKRMFGLAIGAKYIELIGFDAIKRREMEHFLQTMIDEFKSILASADWIDDTSKAKLLDKLLNMRADIGYPDPDTLKLINLYNHITLSESASSYTLNRIEIFKSRAFQVLNDVLDGKLLGISSSLLNISYVLPMTVNAFTLWELNKIYIPAVLFQQPFYDSHALPALNYGSLGSYIAHEVMHNFDAGGILKDATGSQNYTWLSEKFFSAYENKSKCFKEQYNVVEYPENDGYMTVDENLSDNGGVRLAFNAFKRIKGNHPPDFLGYTPEQLFFLALAQIDCTQSPFTSDGQHSYSALRVKGELSNMPEFYNAWNCTIPERQMCRIW